MNKRNAIDRQKRLNETEDERQTRLNKRNAFDKQKRLNETGSERQARLDKRKSFYQKKKSEKTECDKKVQCQNQNKNNMYKNKVTSNKSMHNSKLTTQQTYLKEFNASLNGELHVQSWAKTNILKFHIPVHMLFVNVLFVMKHGLVSQKEKKIMFVQGVQEIKVSKKIFCRKLYDSISRSKGITRFIPSGRNANCLRFAHHEGTR